MITSNTDKSFSRASARTGRILVISLENGGHIITRPFPKERATRVDVTNVKGRAARLDPVDIFWPSDDRSEGYPR